MKLDEKEILQSALEILGVKYSKADSDERLKELLINALNFWPKDEHFWEIDTIVRTLVNISNDSSKSKKLLSRLKELSYYIGGLD